MWSSVCLNHVCVLLFDMCEWFSKMNRRRFLLFMLSTTFMVMSAVGVGVWVIILFTGLSKLRVGYITCGGGDNKVVERPVLSSNNSRVIENETRKRPTSSGGQENRLESNQPPPPKRGRKSKYHDGHHCGPCSVRGYGRHEKVLLYNEKGLLNSPSTSVWVDCTISHCVKTVVFVVHAI